MKLDTLYPNYTYALKIPGFGSGATATICLTEDLDGQLINVGCNIGRAGTVESAWCNALARMTTMALLNTSLDEVIAELSDISTDRVVETNGIVCRSGPEAFAIALRHYRSEKSPLTLSK